jgi:hypothetical protein
VCVRVSNLILFLYYTKGVERDDPSAFVRTCGQPRESDVVAT